MNILDITKPYHCIKILEERDKKGRQPASMNEMKQAPRHNNYFLFSK